ncbi:MAG: helix-turn-helix domain-containing protein [Patescibacteria group bacterium]|jgi:cytoskeletal protein RodZ
MKSIGQILINERKRRKLTLEDVQSAIKIHAKYIKALESDEYGVFDGKTHAKGFLKTYVEFLELDMQEVMALWRREYEKVFENRSAPAPDRFSNLKVSNLVLTPALFVSVIVFVLITAFFGYLYYQYKSFNDAPFLEVTYPENNFISKNSIVDVVGKTDVDSSVFVNNQKVLLNTDGSFATSIKMNEGINTLSILSVNKLDKKTELVRTIIFRPELVPDVMQTSQSSSSAPPNVLEDITGQ